MQESLLPPGGGRKQQDEEEELSGLLERLTFQSAENGYTVARLKVEGRRDTVTVTGVMPGVGPGEELKLRGRWRNHPKYGEQFEVSSHQSVEPSSSRGIEKYLGSGLVKGIGPVTAERIVARFGEKTLEVMDSDITRLSEVEGIGRKRLSQIAASWKEQQEIREVMVFLQGHGVGTAMAGRIYRRYGSESLRLVKENPYRLAYDVSGIGFQSADRIAAELGVPRDSVERSGAGLLNVLHEQALKGHTYVPYEELVESTSSALEVERETVLRAFGKLSEEGEIVVEDLAGREVEEANRKAVYLASLHRPEVGIAQHIERLLKGGAADIRGLSPALAAGSAEHAIADWQQRTGFSLARKQREAIERAAGGRVLVITGGPGTGKTTIVRALLALAEGVLKTPLLLAPTGRAAKRLSETSGQEARTIHRALEYSPGGEGGFGRNERNPLEADLVIVDECSMIDTVLMYQLLRAIPDGASLVLVGDVDQLPSVGPGSVLRDLVDSGAVPSVRLDEIYRQARESLIVLNAHAINGGEPPLIGQEGSREKDGRPVDFHYLNLTEAEDIQRQILKLALERIPARFGLDPVRDVQVLTPMHKGLLGTRSLNAELRKALNPGGTEITLGERKLPFSAGDKVMQVMNDYDRLVFNGDIGYVSGPSPDGRQMVVDFEGRSVGYEPQDLEAIVPAYAITVHKSQGSEFPAVIIPLHTEHFLLLERNLLYTAVTRGRQLVVLLGPRRAVEMAVGNDRPRVRRSGLLGRLENSR